MRIIVLYFPAGTFRGACTLYNTQPTQATAITKQRDAIYISKKNEEEETRDVARCFATTHLKHDQTNWGEGNSSLDRDSLATAGERALRGDERLRDGVSLDCPYMRHEVYLPSS